MNVSFFEQQEQRMNKQFISIFDSAYFVSEHGKGTLQQAFDLIVGSLLRQQTYLLLITPTSVKAVYVCSSNEHSQYEPFITFESIAYELKACLDCGNIGIGNPIYKLGFAKKRFVEQLVNIGMQLDEQIIFDTESPDITHAEHDNDSDELAFYQGLPKEYDTLRAENEKIKAQYQELWNKKERPEAFFNIQKNLYEGDRQRLNECKDKLDKLSVDYKYLESQHDYYKRNYESKKKNTDLIQQIAEKRISELENQLAQAKAELAGKPSEDKELAPNSQTKVACMLYAILKTHDYDLSPPMGKGLANDLIVNASQVQGTPVTKNFVAEWLKRANQAKINCSKK